MIVGGVGQSPQVHALQRGVDILVATPGRLVDLRQQGYIDLRAIEIFVLDEADRMLDMGFLPEVKRIVAMVPEQKQTLFFSATMPKEIAELAEGLLHHPGRDRIAPVKLTTDLVTQWVCHIPKPSKPRLLATMLKTQPISRAIVFTRTKHGADRLAHQLEKVGIAALALHGDKSQSARQRALAHFKSSHPPILVATRCGPLAGSTSMGSRTSSTLICPTSRRPMSTGSAGRDERGPAGSRSRSATTARRVTCGRLRST